MLTAEEFLTHFRRQREWTRALVEAIPEDDFDWGPTADTFRCGDLVRHMMQAEVFWRTLVMTNARGETFDPFELPGSPQEKLTAFRERNVRSSRSDKWGTSFAECLEKWRDIQSETEAELGALTEEQLEVQVDHPLTGLQAPLWEMLLVMIAHEGHHRGQLSAYLKAMGVDQPFLFG